MTMTVLNELMRRSEFRNDMGGEFIHVSNGKLIIQVNRGKEDHLRDMIESIGCGILEYTLGRMSGDDHVQMMFEEGE